MALNQKFSNRLLAGSFAIAASAILVMSFQNCSKVGFVQSKDTLQSLSATSQTVYTDLNTPKTFEAIFSDKAPGVYPSFDDSSITKSLKSGSTVSIAELEKSTFTYKPALGFRGSETVVLHLKDKYGNATTNLVTFVVANPLHELQPAMAIRTPGCINCHAQVASSYITDFGAGDSYFFGKPLAALNQNPLNGGGISMYSDRISGEIAWGSAQFGSSIIVPKVQFGFDLQKWIQQILDTNNISAPYRSTVQELLPVTTAQGTLGEYIRVIEKNKPAMYGTPSKASSVVEKEAVFIGAPSVAVLKQRTAIGSARYEYFKNSESSPPLAGLKDNNTYFEITDLTCDGDLVFTTPVFLKNLKLKTSAGCRIYSTQAIFVNGTVTYDSIDNSNMSNLQLVSSEWVNFGTGLNHCESASNPGWYHSNNPNTNPFDHRLEAYAAPTRATPDATALTNWTAKLKGELRDISGFKDASCEAGANPRAVGYDHILVNAPRIDSRYTGKVQGVLITEVALFALSSFAYSYDPVFNSVPVLPFLETTDYLNVK